VSVAGGAVVRTVRGDITPSELGPTDAHEHFFFSSPLQPGDEYSDVNAAIEEGQSLVASGVRSVVDWTPHGTGRDPRGLREVSEKAGLHVVAATGLHRRDHYGPGHPVLGWGEDLMAATFEADLVAAEVPAGVIKLGASYQRLQPFEQTVMAAAARAHRQTGAPVCVHTEHGTMGLELVQRLSGLGVPARSVVLAHLDRNPDAGEHAETAAAGAWLAMDGPGRARYWPDSTIIALIAELAERGWGERLLLGGDTGRRTMMRAYGGGPGMTYAFARFKPRLERELGASLSEQIFVANPASAFAFVPSGGYLPATREPPGTDNRKELL
jgi:predicted metal-dependent phosphotriesterase family hydrolase